MYYKINLLNLPFHFRIAAQFVKFKSIIDIDVLDRGQY